MTPKKSDNGFDGLVAIQLCTKSWPGIVNLTPKDLGLEDKEVPEFYHLGNKKLYPAEWRQAFNRKVSEARRFLNDNTFDFVLEWVRCSPKGRMAKTIERLEQFKVEYLALADEFCEKYDSIREDWKAFCELKWPGSWEKMAPHYPANSQVLRRKFDMFWTITEIKAAEPPTKTSSQEILEAYSRAKAELESKCKEAVELAFLDYQKRILEVVDRPFRFPERGEGDPQRIVREGPQPPQLGPGDEHLRLQAYRGRAGEAEGWPGRGGYPVPQGQRRSQDPVGRPG